MDKIIALSESSPQISNVDETKFVKFMQRIPIWEHFKIRQQKYLNKSVEEKTAIINEYYDFMDRGKKGIFNFF